MKKQRERERESRKSLLAVPLDDDDDDGYRIHSYSNDFIRRACLCLYSGRYPRIANFERMIVFKVYAVRENTHHNRYFQCRKNVFYGFENLPRPTEIEDVVCLMDESVANFKPMLLGNILVL